MDEYIKREDALEILRQKQRDICPVGRCGHGYVYGRDRDEFDAIEADIDTLENIPAADVAPVVHGKWNDNFECSCCGELQPIKYSPYPAEHSAEEDYIMYESNFCPNCGAKMDL